MDVDAAAIVENLNMKIQEEKLTLANTTNSHKCSLFCKQMIKTTHNNDCVSRTSKETAEK